MALIVLEVSPNETAEPRTGFLPPIRGQNRLWRVKDSCDANLRGPPQAGREIAKSDDYPIREGFKD